MTGSENVTRMGQDRDDSRSDDEVDGPVGADLATEAEAEPLTVAHVHGGTKPGEWKHGGYVLLGGTLTARHWLERKVRRVCEVLARDQGYAVYRDLPEIRRGLTRRLAEVDVAASLMWASGVQAGRLVDRYFDVVSMQRKLARELGLDRVLRDAKVLDLHSYVAQRYGGRGEGSEVPAASSDGPPGAAQGPVARPGEP